MSEALAVIEISELLILLLIAIGVAIITNYIKFPYTSALVIVGLIVGLADLVPDIVLSEELVFFVFLPPLLFEGALRMDIEHLREQIKPILFFAIPGVIISTSVVGLTLHLILGLSLPLSLLFGAMISPTDPVSVLAVFKKLGVPIKLSTLIEGESVFNDGTGIVIFGILLSMVTTGELSIISGVATFIFVVLGGLIVGLAAGFGVYKILNHIDDRLIEVTLTIILAFSAFIIAEELHTSGVIAVVVAGLIMGNYGRIMSMTPGTRIALTTFWDLWVFIINSFLFILIGKEINPGLIADSSYEIIIAILAVLFGRAMSVYPLSFIYNRISRTSIHFNWQHTSFWGGLHGSIPVALALGLTREFPMRDLILAMTFGAVFFSLVIQGLSFELVVPLFKLKSVSEEEIIYEKKLGESIGIKSAIKELELMDENREVSRSAINELKRDYKVRKEDLIQDLARIVKESDDLKNREYSSAHKRSLQAKKSAISTALRKGIIGETAAEILLEDINKKIDIINQNGH